MDKWNEWYKNLTSTDLGSFCYGDTLTYRLGFEFLFPSCSTIEDWGCGTGGFRRFFENNKNSYIGLDGSYSPFADKKVDLTKYQSKTDGIFMRHVLEHNYEWEEILTNACSSFTKKMCLVLFTPISLAETVEIAHNRDHGVDVPDLSLSEEKIFKIFDRFNISFIKSVHKTDTGYNTETVFLLSKSL